MVMDRGNLLSQIYPSEWHARSHLIGGDIYHVALHIGKMRSHWTESSTVALWLYRKDIMQEHPRKHAANGTVMFAKSLCRGEQDLIWCFCTLQKRCLLLNGTQSSNWDYASQ
jgi:hypothetical protein